MSAQVTTTQYLTSSGQVVQYAASSSAGLATLRGPVRLAVPDETATDAALDSEAGR